MRNQKFLNLLTKYFQGILSAEEKDELYKRYRSIGFKDAIYPDNQEAVRKRMLDRLNGETIIKKQKLLNFNKWRKIAAVAAIIVMVALLLLFNYREKSINDSAQITKNQPIVPGSSVAILTLGNGQKLSLSTANTGTIARQGNVLIKKNTAGQITYELMPVNKTTKVESNTITTPAGGQFKIKLPDNSEVWLNAASSLTYPSVFTGAERRVILTGEAYFEIAKNRSQPFIVITDKATVKVTGTHFNIMSYQNEPAIATTLLEGAVSLTSVDKTVMLKPGQQGLTSRFNFQIQIHKANVNDVVAWKNGYFSFRSENIQTVMRKISRWYNVDIEYIGKPSDELMGGTVSRSASISELLKKLQLTDIGDFKIEGRRIMVKTK